MNYASRGPPRAEGLYARLRAPPTAKASHTSVSQLSRETTKASHTSVSQLSKKPRRSAEFSA
ncbi:hypothetical protein BCR34DRAFT_579191, partial [Clohesyomyces aquaticus]